VPGRLKIPQTQGGLAQSSENPRHLSLFAKLLGQIPCLLKISLRLFVSAHAIADVSQKCKANLCVRPVTDFTTDGQALLHKLFRLAQPGSPTPPCDHAQST